MNMEDFLARFIQYKRFFEQRVNSTIKEYKSAVLPLHHAPNFLILENDAENGLTRD
jgi:hypothetical protein